MLSLRPQACQSLTLSHINWIVTLHRRAALGRLLTVSPLPTSLLLLSHSKSSHYSNLKSMSTVLLCGPSCPRHSGYDIHQLPRLLEEFFLTNDEVSFHSIQATIYSEPTLQTIVHDAQIAQLRIQLIVSHINQTPGYGPASPSIFHAIPRSLTIFPFVSHGNTWLGPVRRPER